MGWMLTRATLRGTLAQIRHVAPVPPSAAHGQVAAVYRQVQRDFGLLAPPVSLHAPAPGPLAACWLMLRETLIAAGHATRAEKEAVAVAVSAANACPYCVEVHVTAAHGLLSRRDAAGLVAEADPDATLNPTLRAITSWARDSGLRSRAGCHPPPFPREQAPELIGVAVCFHYLNRMVNVFLDRSPVPPGLPEAVRGYLPRVIGRLIAPITQKARPPGASLNLLPPAGCPDDLAWAAGNPTIADAFGRAAAAVEVAGRRAVSPAVRELVCARLATWDGRPRLDPDWVERAVAQLPAEDRPAGRLALRTAFASDQVGDREIQAVRDRSVDDETLIALTAWASLAAARRIGTWLPAEPAIRKMPGAPAATDDAGAN